MAQGGANDFFLKFDSNAAPFSEKLAADLTPGIEQLDKLRVALEDYEAQASRSKGGSSPLGASFSGLDDALARMERTSSEFTSRLSSQFDQMSKKFREMVALADKVGRETGSSSGGTRSTGSSASGGPSSEDSRAYDSLADATHNASANATRLAVDVGTLSASFGDLRTQLKSLLDVTQAADIPTPQETAERRGGGGGGKPKEEEKPKERPRAPRAPVVAPIEQQRQIEAAAAVAASRIAHITAANPLVEPIAQDQRRFVGINPRQSTPVRTEADVQAELGQLARTIDNTRRKARHYSSRDEDDPRLGGLNEQVNGLVAQRKALQAERDVLRTSSPVSQLALTAAPRRLAIEGSVYTPEHLAALRDMAAATEEEVPPRTFAMGGVPRRRPMPFADDGSQSEPARRPTPGPGQVDEERTAAAPERVLPKGLPELQAEPGGYYDLRNNRGVQNAFEGLDANTRGKLLGARDAIASGTQSQADIHRYVSEAAAAVQADSQVRNRSLFPQGAEDRQNLLAGALGMDPQARGMRPYLRDQLKDGGYGSNFTQESGKRDENAPGADGDASQERMAKLADINATASEKVRNALRAEFIAQNNLNDIREKGTATASQEARALIQLSDASRRVSQAQTEQAAKDNPSLFGKITGRTDMSFGQAVQNRLGHELPNLVGYSLIFTGFEKLQEVVHTGLEAQAAFARLQASLDANGIAAKNLATNLANISATTATPIETVIQAASELSGTFKTAGTIEFGANIASQLALISQGALSATEAADDLRDVYSAFGNAWTDNGLVGGKQTQKDIQAGLQRTGNQIAYLSQTTGVNVKDITEGTAEIAPEAREFGLNQYQASTLSAYITKSTGLQGEESSSLLTRMMATLYNGATQTALVKSGIATEGDFTSGDIGKVIQQLIGGYDKLKPNSRQQIASLMGTGPAAKVFSALVSGGAAASAAFTNDPNKTNGAIDRQQQLYLSTISGQVKKLSEDFENMGVELQKVGAFDAIGALAVALDKAAVGIRNLLDGLTDLWGSIFGHSQIATDMMHLVVIIGEGAAAWKLFGSAAVSAMNKVGILKMTPTNSTAIAGAEAEGAVAPAAAYSTSMGAVAGNIGGRVAGVAQTGARTIGSAASDIRGGNFALADATPAGLRARAVVANAEANEADAIEARTKAEMDVTATEEDQVAALEAQIKAEQTLTAAVTDGAALEEDLNKLRADQIDATTTFTAAAERAAAAQTALAVASERAALAATESATASTAQAEVRAGGVAGSMGAAGGLLGIGAILAAGPVGRLIAGGQTAANSNGVRPLFSSIGTGALEGAGAGALIGSILPGPGTAAGAAVGGVAGTLYGAGKGVLAARSAGNAYESAQSGNDEIALSNLVYNDTNAPIAIRNAQKSLGYKAPVKGRGIDQVDTLSTASDVTAFEKSEEAFINKHASDIETEGGNSKAAQAIIKHRINQMMSSLKTAAASRLETLQGLTGLDQLNLNQIDVASDLASTISQLTPNTMATQGSAIRQMLSDSGLASNSHNQKLLDEAAGQANNDAGTIGLNSQGHIGHYDTAGRWHPATMTAESGIGPTEGAELRHVSSPLGTFQSRRAAADEFEGNVVKATTAQLSSGKYGVGTDQWNDLKQRQSAALLAKQTLDAEKFTIPQQIDQAQSSFFQNQGQDGQAVTSLQSSNAQLVAYNKTLQKDDPQYWANLTSIQENKAQIAQLQANPAINALTIAAGSATDASQQASLQYQLAVKTLQKDEAGPHTSTQIADDKAAVAQRRVGISEAGAAASEAGKQAQIAGIRNDVQKGQAQLNDALGQEARYRNGGSLADQANYENAVAQEVQDRIAIRDAIEAQTQSEYDVTAALQTLHGDAVGAAATELKKASQAYAYAVGQYGKNSEEADAALSNVIQTRTSLIAAQLAVTTSALDLQIAKLNARGGQGDAVRAAQDDIAKAKAAISSYLNHGGKKGTAQFDELEATLVTAQRSKFDTALQAQLDTLDFQQQTYKITSAQEVASLQQILKNKDLTLKEQRDITLKIKNMQESIRDQLTQGGLNIPSDITLPTAYDVRRSLGSGFSGSATTASTVTNNNQQVTVNNNVPNAAVAHAIANEVIKKINGQSSRQGRANTSTPRVVNTR